MKPDQNLIDTEKYLETLLEFHKTKLEETSNDNFMRVFLHSKIDLLNNIKDHIEFIKKMNHKKEQIEESLKALETV